MAVDMTLSNCSLFAAASLALYLDSSNWTNCSVVVRHTTLTAAGNMLLVQHSSLYATNVTLMDSKLSTAKAFSWTFSSCNLSNSSIMVYHTLIEAASSAFAIQQSALVAVNVAFLDSGVISQSAAAWSVMNSNLTASSVVMHHVQMTADTYIFVVQEGEMRVSNVTLVECVASSGGTGTSGPGGLIFDSVALSASVVVVRSSMIAAASDTFLLQRISLTDTLVLLEESSLSAADSWAWACFSATCTSTIIVLNRTVMSASSETVLVQQTFLRSVSVSLMGCNVSAESAKAIYLDGLNASTSSIVTQGCWIAAETDAFLAEKTSLTSTNMSLLESTVISESEHALRLVDTAWRLCGVVLSSTSLTAAFEVVMMQRTVHVQLLVSSCLLRCTAAQQRSCVSMSDMLDSTEFAVSSSLVHVDVATQNTSGVRGVAATVVFVSNSTLSTWTCSTYDSRFFSVSDAARLVLFVNCTLTTLSISMMNSSLLVHRDDDAASHHTTEGVVVLESSRILAMYALLRGCAMVHTGPQFSFSDSRVELRWLQLQDSNFVTSAASGVAQSDVSFFRVLRGSVHLDNVRVERSRFAGLGTLFFASSLLSALQVATSVYHCSWWSHSPAEPFIKWRPLTKLQLGLAVFLQSPTFDAVDEKRCGIATVSTSVSGTVSAVAQSATSSAEPSWTETSGLTASANTSTFTCSVTKSREATASPVVAERLVRQVTGSDVGYAAFVGAAIAATSFSAVRSGLTAQRVAFVIRSTGRKCGALGDGAAIEDNSGADVDWLSSPTRISIGSGAEAAHRGAVVGNVALCVGAAVVAAVSVGCAIRAGGLSVGAAVSRLRVRRALCAPVLLLIEPTLASSVALLAGAGGAAGVDVIVGVGGAASVACAVSALVRVLDPRVSRFRARAEALRRVPLLAPSPASVQELLRGAWRWWAAACVVWRPTAGHGQFVLEWGFLFDDCRGSRHWWALVDVCVSMALGVLGGVVPYTSARCAAWKWTIVAVACCGVVLPVVAVPLNSPRAMCQCVTMVMLTALMAILGAVDASDAVIEGIGILSAVLEWFPILLHLLVWCRSSHSSAAPHNDAVAQSAAHEESESSTHIGGLSLRGVRAFTPSAAFPEGAKKKGASLRSTDRNCTREQQMHRHLGGQRILIQRQQTVLRALISLVCYHQQQQRMK